MINFWNIDNVATRKRLNLLIFLLPPLLTLVLFFVIPLLIVVLYSFLERGTYGGINWQFTLENYQRLAKGIYWLIFAHSLLLASVTTIICLLIGYPLAFFIATRPQPWRNFCLFLAIIPFWTNFLVRTYAWIVLLRTEGIINTLLQSLHLIERPLQLLFTPLAVTIGLIYGYLPLMILPLYTQMEKFNFSLIEAAQDLGANDWKTLVRVVLPLTSKSIISGSVLVFVPCIGAFITPDLLGGAKTLMIGNVIQTEFLKVRDWGFGSVLSIIMMAVVLIPVLVYLNISERE
jgi:spermidine/putrescine transport system permease protein